MSHCGYALLNQPGNGNRGCWQEAMSKREENQDGKQAGSLNVMLVANGQMDVILSFLPQGSSSIFKFATNTNLSEFACFLSFISTSSQSQFTKSYYTYDCLIRHSGCKCLHKNVWLELSQVIFSEVWYG
jgi:hypothetical protein